MFRQSCEIQGVNVASLRTDLRKVVIDQYKKMIVKYGIYFLIFNNGYLQ